MTHAAIANIRQFTWTEVIEKDKYWVMNYISTKNIIYCIYSYWQNQEKVPIHQSTGFLCVDTHWICQCKATVGVSTIGVSRIERTEEKLTIHYV